MNWPVLKSGLYPSGHFSRMVLVSGSTIVTFSISISTIGFAIKIRCGSFKEMHACVKDADWIEEARNRPALMANDEFRMTNAERMTKPEIRMTCDRSRVA